MKRIIAVLAVAVLLGGCGGSSAAPEDIGAKLGCTPVAASSQELYVKGLQTCQVDGQPVSIYTFASSGDRDSWWDVAKGFVGEGKMVKVGDTVVVSADDTATADVVRQKLG